MLAKRVGPHGVSSVMVSVGMALQRGVNFFIRRVYFWLQCVGFCFLFFYEKKFKL